MAGFEVPREVLIMGSLPRKFSGNLLKRDRRSSRDENGVGSVGRGVILSAVKGEDAGNYRIRALSGRDYANQMQQIA